MGCCKLQFCFENNKKSCQFEVCEVVGKVMFLFFVDFCKVSMGVVFCDIVGMDFVLWWQDFFLFIQGVFYGEYDIVVIDWDIDCCGWFCFVF